MKEKQILIVDDDIVLSDMLSEYLSEENYDVTVANDGLQGLNKARAGNFDLIILDVMLPTINGMEILKRLRSDNDTPVLMLTARGDDVDRILGLEIGADDYLPKPFNTRELVARMKAILRRYGDKPSKDIWQVGKLKVDTRNWLATYNNESIEFTTAEFRILNTLFNAKGSPVTREVLTQDALGRPMIALERAIDTHASNLRKKLQKLGVTEVEIKSVRGVGYVMIERSTGAHDESE